MIEKINWDAVFEAQKRGKRGVMRPGDQELCERAYLADKTRYSEQADQARDIVDEEVNPLLERK